MAFKMTQLDSNELSLTIMRYKNGLIEQRKHQRVGTIAIVWRVEEEDGGDESGFDDQLL